MVLRTRPGKNETLLIVELSHNHMTMDSDTSLVSKAHCACGYKGQACFHDLYLLGQGVHGECKRVCLCGPYVFTGQHC